MTTSPRTIRAAYLCEFPTLLGGERSLLVFLDHCGEAGIDPVVVAPGEGALAGELARRNIPRVDWPEGGRHEAEQLEPILRDLGIDLVHANSLMVGEAALTAGRACGVPAIGHVRDIMSISAARAGRFSHLSAIVAVSDAVAAWLGVQGVPSDRIVVISNAVDTRALRASAAAGSLRQELGVDADLPLVGCVGQIALRKGQDLFLDAAARLAERQPDAQFVLAGERYSRKTESINFEAALRARASAPPLTSRFHWLGYREDAPAVLAALNVVVIPSRQEPLSRVLLESLALGTAAVATDVGGMREIAGDGECVSLVPPNDPDAIASAMELMLRSNKLRTRHEEHGRQRAGDFSPERQVKAMRTLYERVMHVED